MVERLTRWCTGHPRLFDATVAIFWTMLSFANDSIIDDPSKLAYLGPLYGVAGLALFFRRRFALGVWLFQALIVLAMVFVDADADVPISLVCGAYSLGAHGRVRNTGIAAFAGFLVIGVLTVLIIDFGAIPDAVAVTLVLTIGWITGDSMRTRRAYQQSLLDRAERAEALRDSLAHRAVAEERGRIARDLHDVVAHSMSLMVVQAGAARRVARTDPDASVHALEAIESVGRNSLEEMRRILDVLRSDGDEADTAPQPDIAAIEALVDEFAAANLAVDLVRTGDVRPLGHGVELTAYRIVQESLTNVLKHANAQQASITLAYTPDNLDITVRDDGDGSGSKSPEPGSQRGHIGIRERVAAYGGAFSAGPRLTGGYEVNAEIPLREDDE